MASRKRHAWYPSLVKRRKTKMALQNSKKKLFGKKKEKDKKKKKIAVKITPAVSTVRTSTVRRRQKKSVVVKREMVACSEPQPECFYNIGPPLLAERLRGLLSLFDRNPPVDSDDFAISADKEALLLLFPAVHNGEWFATLTEFLEHCGSVSHKLLCENGPLFPLITFSDSERRKTSSTEPLFFSSFSFFDFFATDAVAESKMELSRGDDITFSDDKRKKRNKSNESKRDAVLCHSNDTTEEEGEKTIGVKKEEEEGLFRYYWWLVRIHTALVQVCHKEWQSWLRFCDSFSLTSLPAVAKAWCCFRLFQANVADAVAKRLALFSKVKWETLTDAAWEIGYIVLTVYMNMSGKKKFFYSFSGMDDGVIWGKHPPFSDTSLQIGSDTPPDVAVMKVVMEGDVDSSLMACERRAIVSLSIQLAKVVIGMNKQENDVLWASGLDVTLPCVEEHCPPPSFPPTVSLLAHTGESMMMTNMINCNESKEEERIMALVLWLYLSASAVNSDLGL